ncbi:MAG: pyruvate synthase subunit beta, partial [Candidatus Omnitrophica bacterium]|nr:pyruvate synthase subunit beta [Candidatus Omnitrophota bacterium]
QKARSIKGPKFIQILSPCPVGWKFPSHLAIKMAKLAFETCVYPLYEVENSKYIIRKPRNKKLVSEYFGYQGRFRHLKTEEISGIQQAVDREWELLLSKENLTSVVDAS